MLTSLCAYAGRSAPLLFASIYYGRSNNPTKIGLIETYLFIGLQVIFKDLYSAHTHPKNLKYFLFLDEIKFFVLIGMLTKIIKTTSPWIPLFIKILIR